MTENKIRKEKLWFGVFECPVCETKITPFPLITAWKPLCDPCNLSIRITKKEELFFRFGMIRYLRGRILPCGFQEKIAYGEEEFLRRLKLKSFE